MPNELDLLPVRKTLNERFKIDDSRIGFDPVSGFVTVDNQKILKPPTNQDGTTFAGQDVFNSAAGQLNTLNDAYNVQQQALHPQQQVNPYDSQVGQLLDQIRSQMQIRQVNPYDSQVQGLVSQIQQQVSNPQQIDPYSTPQYAAAQQQVQQAAQQGIRANQEATGASGFGRSTINTQGAQRIQNQADQQLQTQIVPQIIGQLQQEQQQKMNNLSGLFGALTQQQQLTDTRQQNTLGDLLGLLNPLAQQQQTQDARFQQQQNRLGDVLNFMTGRQDRAEDVNFRNNQADLQQQNLQEDRAYQQARDQIKDQQYQQQFDEDVRRFGLNNALENAKFNNQLSQQAIDNAMAQSRLALDQSQLDFQKQQAQQKNSQSTQLTTEDMAAERSGLTTQLTKKQVSPVQALQTIDIDLKEGYYTPEQADQLRSIVTQFANSTKVQQPAEEKSKLGLTASNQEKALGEWYKLSDAQKEEVILSGGNQSEYAEYTLDPNGGAAGLSFPEWHKLYKRSNFFSPERFQ